MNIIPRAGPPPLPSSTGAAASIRIPRFVSSSPSRRASFAQFARQGEVHRQSLEGRQIQPERPVGRKVQRLGRQDAALRIDDEQDIDSELPESGVGDVGFDEIRIVILRETVGVYPVAPVRGRDGDPVNHQVERKVDAPHGDAGVPALQLREARHDDLLLDQDFGDPEGQENTCRKGCTLGADVHLSKLKGFPGPGMSGDLKSGRRRGQR